MKNNLKIVSAVGSAKRDTHEIPIEIVHQPGDEWGEIDTLTISPIDDRRRKLTKFMVVYDDCHLVCDHIEIIDDPLLTEAEWIKKAVEEYLKLSEFWVGEPKLQDKFRRATDKYISELDDQ